MSKELTQQMIGTLIPEEAQRDAIHIAVAPAIAKVKVFPGQDVGLSRTADTDAPHVGICDPFLKSPVFPGQRYFVFLYPNTITGLRHEWTHPAFDVPTTISQENHVEKSRAWIKAHAEELDLTENALMRDAGTWLECEEHTVQHGSQHWRGTLNATEFWHHYEIVTGKVVEADKKRSFYCCTC